MQKNKKLAYYVEALEVIEAIIQKPAHLEQTLTDSTALTLAFIGDSDKTYLIKCPKLIIIFLSNREYMAEVREKLNLIVAYPTSA